MRQTQQNNRRGRSRPKKSQNPFSRNFESNGPDVKIRGSAQHIADKYNSLSRDAMSSGDYVQSENYLQHAEHYNRIMMAAQNAKAKAAEEKSDEKSAEANGEASEGEKGKDFDGHVLEDFNLTLSQVNGQGGGKSRGSRSNGKSSERSNRSNGSKNGRVRRSNSRRDNGRGKTTKDPAAAPKRNPKPSPDLSAEAS